VPERRAYKGWFLGAGDEYALSFRPGLFWKTEYRFSRFDTENNSVRDFTTGGPDGFSIDSRKFVQTIRSELVYRFNWAGGAVVFRRQRRSQRMWGRLLLADTVAKVENRTTPKISRK
jgi:hypothetical protein